MTFLEEFEARGFFYQCTNKEDLKALTDNGPITAYIGFDCTAKTLHVGSLMQLMIFRLMQRYGHKPIVIVGGGTTKIGDPSFKDAARKMLDDDAINDNMSGIKATIAKFVTFGNGKSDAIMLNNDEWLSSLNYLEFLRDVGAYFSVNRMLSFDSVKLRLDREQNLSFLEFNYMILQAYDFTQLYKRYNCRLQIGGSDQWGNIVNGVDLNKRLGEKEEIFGLTTPLITTSSGVKMGKTVGGAVWLDENLLSPYDYYQFWRNTEDDDVVRFMKLFTEIPLEKIADYAKLQGSKINEAKKMLAFEATKLCHGEKNAILAAETARKTFEQGAIGDSLPEYKISPSSLGGGIQAFVLFADSKLCESRADAKRLIQGGGAKVNDEVVTELAMIIDSSYLKSGKIKLSSGKKKHVIVVQDIF